MTTSLAPILFLSGAGLPAWIWDGVRSRLGDGHGDATGDRALAAGTRDSAAGARVTAVAARPQCRSPRLEDYARAAIESAPPGQFVMVAHSAGGVVAAEVARIAPARVAGCLALCAIVPHPGGSFISAMPAPNRWVLSAVMRLAGTRPPDSSIRGTLAHGIDAAVVHRLIEDFTPESQAFYRDSAGLAVWECARGYVHTNQDREIPARLQPKFAARLGSQWHSEIDSGHLPMLQEPDATARVIVNFVDTQVTRPR